MRQRPQRPRMKPRAYRRWKRQLAQLERRKGLANDTVFLAALDGAMRASRKAHPEATSMSMDDVLAFADPSAAGRGFYRKVPVAEGHARNRQLRRRR